MTYAGAAAHVEEQVVGFSGLHGQREGVEVTGRHLRSVRSDTIPVGRNGHFNLQRSERERLQSVILRGHMTRDSPKLPVCGPD